jgi:cytochrome c biogenesis protein CcmG/thiol:disulfide interchange protein DsbE
MVGVAAAGLFACGGALGGASGSDSPDGTTTHAKGGLLGNPAPNFSAEAVGSKETVSLQGLRGQVVLLDFWGTFCEPCKKSFPKLEQLSRQYAARGFHVVAISEDEPDDKDKIPQFAATYGAKFTIAWDKDRSIAHGYNPETMPSSFLVDKKGIVRFVHVGYHDGQEADVRREIEELLAK